MRGSQGWKVNMKMEEWASDMQLREENLDQARQDHKGRIGVHAALLIFLLLVLFFIVRGIVAGLAG
jgi:flagellar biosynthesis/type III secretory pathway M-ring protein FliF/YscJ